ncbi:unnamed protein product [Dracunculus medinensis]|uniref:Uncharacterized protein n=1 Tax=Dracunculus medinensis TaxID=318479 RepID=A0A3P7PGA9_DRAME|nr:unnamed protein product [Dracunculus medinensis]
MPTLPPLPHHSFVFPPHTFPTLPPHTFPTLPPHTFPTLSPHTFPTFPPHSLPTLPPHSLPTLPPHTFPTIPHTFPQLSHHFARGGGCQQGCSIGSCSSGCLPPFSTLPPHTIPPLPPHPFHQANPPRIHPGYSHLATAHGSPLLQPSGINETITLLPLLSSSLPSYSFPTHTFPTLPPHILFSGFPTLSPFTAVAAVNEERPATIDNPVTTSPTPVAITLPPFPSFEDIMKMLGLRPYTSPHHSASMTRYESPSYFPYAPHQHENLQNAVIQQNEQYQFVRP